MKKLHFILIAVSVISLMSCEELGLGVEVKSDEVTVDFDIHPTDFIGDTTLAVNAIQSEFDSTLADAGISIEDVTSVKLKEAIIEITNEDANITFDYFESVSAAIKVVGLEELTIASMDTIPEGARVLECTVADNELMDYVSASEYMVLAKGNIIKTIDETIKIKGKLTFSIKTDMGFDMN